MSRTCMLMMEAKVVLMSKLLQMTSTRLLLNLLTFQGKVHVDKNTVGYCNLL